MGFAVVEETADSTVFRRCSEGMFGLNTDNPKVIAKEIVQSDLWKVEWKEKIW